MASIDRAKKFAQDAIKVERVHRPAPHKNSRARAGGEAAGTQSVLLSAALHRSMPDELQTQPCRPGFSSEVRKR